MAGMYSRDDGLLDGWRLAEAHRALGMPADYVLDAKVIGQLAEILFGWMP